MKTHKEARSYMLGPSQQCVWFDEKLAEKEITHRFRYIQSLLQWTGEEAVSDVFDELVVSCSASAIVYLAIGLELAPKSNLASRLLHGVEKEYGGEFKFGLETILKADEAFRSVYRLRHLANSRDENAALAMTDFGGIFDNKTCLWLSEMLDIQRASLIR